MVIWISLDLNEENTIASCKADTLLPSTVHMDLERKHACRSSKNSWILFGYTFKNSLKYLYFWTDFPSYCHTMNYLLLTNTREAKPANVAARSWAALQDAWVFLFGPSIISCILWFVWLPCLPHVMVFFWLPFVARNANGVGLPPRPLWWAFFAH